MLDNPDPPPNPLLNKDRTNNILESSRANADAFNARAEIILRKGANTATFPSNIVIIMPPIFAMPFIIFFIICLPPPFFFFFLILILIPFLP